MRVSPSAATGRTTAATSPSPISPEIDARLKSMSTVAASAILSREHSWADRYMTVRAFSEELCATLETEDYCIQSMPDVSPTRWHLAHTTWFFETFLLAKAAPNWAANDEYAFLFNS